MPIYDHKYGGLDYFRVYRSWGGKEHQEYIRIGSDRKAARREAQAIEKRLTEQYEQYLRERVKTAEYHVRADGSIKGLRRVRVERDARAPVDVLELRVNVPWADKVQRTTISITAHGFEDAFAQAVAKIRDWYELGDDSEAVVTMRECDSHYGNSSEVGALKVVAHKAKNELDSLTQGVFKGLKKLGLSATT